MYPMIIALGCSGDDTFENLYYNIELINMEMLMMPIINMPGNGEMYKYECR